MGYGLDYNVILIKLKIKFIPLSTFLSLDSGFQIKSLDSEIINVKE